MTEPTPEQTATIESLPANPAPEGETAADPNAIAVVTPEGELLEVLPDGSFIPLGGDEGDSASGFAQAIASQPRAENYEESVGAVDDRLASPTAPVEPIEPPNDAAVPVTPPTPEGGATAEEVAEVMPAEEALAVWEGDPKDIFRAMDRNDEVLILEELAGNALDVMVYDFGEGAKRKTDLSIKGVFETTRLMNERGGAKLGVSENPPIVEDVEIDGNPAWRVMVYALDRRQGIGKWGAATEPKSIILKSGKPVDKEDKFAFTKALNKAERNALGKFIPEEWRQMIVGLALEQGRVKRLAVLGETDKINRDLGPAVQGPEADAARQRVNDLYADLRALNPNALPQARFNSFYAQASAESASRLSQLGDWIQEMVDTERAAAEEKAGIKPNPDAAPAEDES